MISGIIIMIHNGAGGCKINSEKYLEWACKKNPDYIEVDVRCTSDMVPVLHHDPYITIDSSNIYIRDITFSGLKKYSPDIVRLDNAIDYIHKHSIGINFDIKELRSVESVIKLLRVFQLSNSKIIFSGCKIGEVREIHKYDPEIPVLLNAEPAPFKESDYETFIKNTLDTVQNENFYGLNIDYRDCSEILVKHAKLLKIPVMVWTIDNREDMERFIELGVNSITTNDIILLREVLKNKLEAFNGNSIS